MEDFVIRVFILEKAVSTGCTSKMSKIISFNKSHLLYSDPFLTNNPVTRGNLV